MKAIMVAALVGCCGSVCAAQSLWRSSEASTWQRIVVSVQFQCDMQAAPGLPSALAQAEVVGFACGYDEPGFVFDPADGVPVSSATASIGMSYAPPAGCPANCRTYPVAGAAYQAAAGYDSHNRRASFLMQSTNFSSKHRSDCGHFCPVGGGDPEGYGVGSSTLVSGWVPAGVCPSGSILGVEVEIDFESNVSFLSDLCLLLMSESGSGASSGATLDSLYGFSEIVINYYDSNEDFLSFDVLQGVWAVSQDVSDPEIFDVELFGDLYSKESAGRSGKCSSVIQIVPPLGAHSLVIAGVTYNLVPVLAYDVNADGVVNYFDRLVIAQHLSSLLGDMRYDLRADLNRDLQVNQDDADILEALPCMADLNENGSHDLFDLDVYLDWFGSGDLNADLDGNGVLNYFDLAIFTKMFGSVCS